MVGWMTRWAGALLISVSLAWAAPAANAQQAKPTEAADTAAVRAVGETWRQLYAAGRYSEIPALYAEDTLVMPRGRARIEGRAQMARSIGGLAAGRRVDIQVTERELKLAGDYAWFVGDFRVTYLSPEPNVAPKTEYGRSFILYRRDADGRWRILRDIDSPAPAPGAAATSAPAATAASPPGYDAAGAPKLWNPADRTAPTKCDQLTASKYDRTRLAKPVAREDMDVAAAIKQCEADLAALPGDPRVLFQLGRIYGYAGDKDKTLAARRAAAAAGNHNAIFLLAYLDFVAAKDDGARCAAAKGMRLAADRGNYSAQLTYASYFLEGKLAACADIASPTEIAAYVKAARPVVDGFFETRFADHLGAELARDGAGRETAAGGDGQKR
jgi:ketosteroid isomerase-like protein